MYYVKWVSHWQPTPQTISSLQLFPIPRAHHTQDSFPASPPRDLWFRTNCCDHTADTTTCRCSSAHGLKPTLPCVLAPNGWQDMRDMANVLTLAPLVAQKVAISQYITVLDIIFIGILAEIFIYKLKVFKINIYKYTMGCIVYIARIGTLQCFKGRKLLVWASNQLHSRLNTTHNAIKVQRKAFLQPR